MRQQNSVSDADMESFKNRVVGRSIGEDTFTAYKLWINRFEMWYQNDDRQGDPTLRDLEDFDTMLEDPTIDWYLWDNAVGRPAPSSYSYSSRNQAISAVKMWVRRQYDVNIPEQPGDIVRGSKDEFDPTYLSRDEVGRVLDEADDACQCPGCKAALSLSYDAILRASELAILDVSDIVDGEVRVTATKGSRNSTVTVSEETTELIAQYLNEAEHDSGRLFRNTYGNPWDKHSWASHVLRCHVPEGSHAWGRHTPILHMLQAGQPFGDVYRRARHVNPSTTARYARYVDVDVPSWADE